MRSGIRGVLAGGLALVALQVLVTTDASRVAGLAGVFGAVARRIINPTIPAINPRADDTPAPAPPPTEPRRRWGIPIPAPQPGGN